MKQANFIALQGRTEDDLDIFVRLVNSYQKKSRRDEMLRKEQRERKKQYGRMVMNEFLNFCQCNGIIEDYDEEVVNSLFDGEEDV
jgi:hypothetical protein